MRPYTTTELKQLIDAENTLAVFSNICHEKARLLQALRPFILAYRQEAEPIGDSDLDNEQPRNITITLGDCRTADALLR
ncbi:MAG: hypothetical protein ACREJW_02150, partial [Candidatus Methylomirabilales bacterium]